MQCASHFSQEYLLYFKEKWCRTAGKAPLFGHVDGFQIVPRLLKRLSYQIVICLQFFITLIKTPGHDPPQEASVQKNSTDL